MQGGRLPHWRPVMPHPTACSGSNSGNSSRCRSSSRRRPALRREGVSQASSHEADATLLLTLIHMHAACWVW
jgi:hypothetical protein